MCGCFILFPKFELLLNLGQVLTFKVLIKFDAKLCFNSKTMSSKPPPCWHMLMFPNWIGGSERCAWLCLCRAKTAVTRCARRKRPVCALPFLALPLSPVLARHPEGQLPWPRKTETAWAPNFHDARHLSHSAFLTQLVNHILDELQR